MEIGTKSRHWVLQGYYATMLVYPERMIHVILSSPHQSGLTCGFGLSLILSRFSVEYEQRSVHIRGEANSRLDCGVLAPEGVSKIASLSVRPGKCRQVLYVFRDVTQSDHGNLASHPIAFPYNIVGAWREGHNPLTTFEANPVGHRGF